MSPHIAVCICTYKRPEFLNDLLVCLTRQITDHQFTYSVVIVDNDRDRGASGVAQHHAAKGFFPVTYLVEPVQNIALARNRAIRNAEADFIAFIDDDELPSEDWLITLLQSSLRTRASGVLGPVEPDFKQPPPEWVLRGKFYHRPSHETDTVLPWTHCRTGNVLFRRRVFEDEPEPFRPQYGSGGEDRDFFRRMIKKGHVFTWCKEAAVNEIIPPIRWDKKFLLKRALLRGKVSAQDSRAVGILKSLVALACYSAFIPFAWVAGEHRFMRCMVSFCDHAGKILGIIGVNPVKETYIIR